MDSLGTRTLSRQGYVSILLSLALVLVFSSCSESLEPHHVPPAAGSGSNWVEAPVDEVGSYLLLSRRAIVSEDGLFSLRLAERHYVGSRQSRFVVDMEGAQSQRDMPAILEVRLSVSDDTGLISTSEIGESLALSQGTDAAYLTELFSVDRFSDGFDARQLCALLEASYADESWFPLRLDSCSRGRPTSSD